MPSADFIYELADKLDKDKFDYLIVAFQKNKTGDEAPVTMIFSLDDDDSKELMFNALTVFKKTVND